jgi:hypothetical protein
MKIPLGSEDAIPKMLPRIRRGRQGDLLKQEDSVGFELNTELVLFPFPYGAF